MYRPVPATEPCTLASTTGYSVPTGYRLHSLVHLLQQLVTECTDRLNSLVQSFQQLVTECIHRVPATQPALNSLLYISRLQNLSASSWPLLISSLFTGLRLMTGLIVCSSRQEVFPTQKLLQPVTELINRLPAIQFS